MPCHLTSTAAATLFHGQPFNTTGTATAIQLQRWLSNYTIFDCAMPLLLLFNFNCYYHYVMSCQSNCNFHQATLNHAMSLPCHSKMPPFYRDGSKPIGHSAVSGSGRRRRERSDDGRRRRCCRVRSSGRGCIFPRDCSFSLMRFHRCLKNKNFLFFKENSVF